MPEIAKILAEYGVFIVLAALVVWEKVASSKTVNKVIHELHMTSRMQTDLLAGLKTTAENTKTALEIVQHTLAEQVKLMERHDKRAEKMNGDIIIILENIRRERS